MKYQHFFWEYQYRQNIDKKNLKNIDIYIDIDMASPENIDTDKDILENIDIDIDRGILQNIDIDKISYR